MESRKKSDPVRDSKHPWCSGKQGGNDDHGNVAEEGTAKYGPSAISETIWI
jgi:hypothetical protein